MVDSVIVSLLLSHAPLTSLTTNIKPVYPDVDKVTLPYVLYVCINAEPDYCLNGFFGDTTYQYQFDYWAKTASENISVGDAIQNLLSGLKNDDVQCSFMQSREVQEEEVSNGSVFHGRQIYTIVA